MKKMQTKRIISVLMLIVMMALLIATCVLFMTPIQTANADGKPSTVTLSFNETEIIPGKVLTLRMTATTLVPDGWSSLMVRIIPIFKDTDTPSSGMETNVDLAKYLIYDPSNPIRFVGDDAAEFTERYDLTPGNQLTNATNPFFNISVSARNYTVLTDSQKPMIVEVPLTVSDDLLDLVGEDAIDTIALSVRPAKTTKIVYGITGNQTTNLATSDIDLNVAKVGVKIPSTNPDLSELKMGIGDDLKAVDLTKSPLTYTITGSDLSNFTILPTAKDGASIKVGLTLPAATEAPSGEKTKLAITTSTTAVYIETTAEDGTTTKRYTVAIKIAYVALSDLTVTSTPVTTGVTKNGLATEFESDTLNYDVNVPEKATMTKISATIVTGFDTNKTISLTGENCTPARGSLTSGGTEVNILQVKEGSVLKLTLTAPDGTTKRVYTLTFHKLSENTGIDSIKVKGATTNTEYANDAAKAKDEKVDYYFVLDSEPDEEPKGVFAITTAEENATIKIGTAEYSETAQFAMGTYDVIITAAAGNTHTYKVVLSGVSVLEFAEGSPFKYIFESEEWEDPEFYHYRRSYAEKGLVHGKDDKDFEKFVIGGVKQETTVRAFLANFPENQQSSIKLYDNYGTLIVDRGNPATGVDESDLNTSEIYSIGTGWYIEYGKGETPTETVYISVLGDLDGDGIIGPDDKVMLLAALGYAVEFTLEQRLAAYIGNEAGVLDPQDCVVILSLIGYAVDIEDYL